MILYKLLTPYLLVGGWVKWCTVVISRWQTEAQSSASLHYPMHYCNHSVPVYLCCWSATIHPLGSPLELTQQPPNIIRNQMHTGEIIDFF